MLLIVLAGDESKPVVALGKVYFVVQTHRQELADELALSALPEDQKHLIYRSEMAILNAKSRSVLNRSGNHRFSTNSMSEKGI